MFQRSRVLCHSLLLLALLASPLPLVAQGTGSVMDLDRMSSARQNTVLGQMLSGEQVPTDDVVVPSAYMMGPGDVIAYQTTGIDFSEKMAMVSPENTLLLERFGLVSLTEMSLQDLRDTLQARMRRRAPDVDVYVTLRKPRLVYVTLKGNVQFPGTYAVPASMRISTLLTITRQPWLLMKNGGTEEIKKMGPSVSMMSATNELTRQPVPELSPYALRNIVVRHRHGSSMVDLALAQIPGNEHHDPHVREGDMVTVPFDAERIPTISVSGAVATPATLAFKPGDRASVLLAAAGGPTNEADLSRVVLVQAGGEGKAMLSVDQDLRITGTDPELQPGSSIIVERMVTAGEPARQGVVEVYGEVAQPGTVVIQPGLTRVAEVIARAGGVNSRAAVALSYIVRPDQTTRSERQIIDNANRRFMYSDLTLEDTLRYKMDQSYRLPYVSCDLATALRDTASRENVVLQNGDIIVIESTPDRVFVYGQVNRPGYVGYVPGKTLEWYVDQAGGFATGAKAGRSRIIKGKTKVWVEDDEAVVEPGDEVYVPRPPDIPASVEIQTYAAIAAIASAIALLTTTVLTIFR